MSSPAAPTVPTRSARRGRWVRRLALAAAAGAVLIALAPFLIGPLLARWIERRIEAELDVTARLQSASFRWPGRLRLRGLELADARGERLAALDELRVRARPGALLAGRIEAEVDLAYPELHVARTEDGSWNWQRALAPAQARAERAPTDVEETEEVPRLRLHLSVADGHVIVHGPGGETTLSSIGLELALEDLAAPAPFALQLDLRGPEGPAGALALAGSFTAAAGGRIAPATLAATAHLTLTRLDLAACAPALGLVAPDLGLEGVLQGSAELELASGLALSGTTALALEELALAGPLSQGAPARLARVELTGRATQDGTGAGTQELELTAESFLTLSYSGRSELATSGTGSLSGALRVDGELGRLTDVARAWIPFQPGVALGGRLEARAELGATLREGAAESFRIELTSALAQLAARAPDGRALELAELREVALALAASGDLARDELALTAFELRAGPLQATAALTAGAPRDAGPLAALRTGRFQLSADLDRLRGPLASVIELGATPLGGRLTASGELTGTPEELTLGLALDGSALAAGPASLAAVRGALDLRRATGGALTGRGQLALGALTLRLEEGAALALPPARLEFEAGEDEAGAGRQTLTFTLEEGRLRMSTHTTTRRSGARIELEGTLELDGDVAELAALAAPFAPLQPGLAGTLAVRGELEARAQDGQPEHLAGRLTATLAELAAADSEGVVHRLEALARTRLALAGSFEAATGRAELSELGLEAGGLKLAGQARLTGLAGDARIELEEGRFTLECDPERLGRELASVLDLGGWSVGGSPLTAEVRCLAPAGRLEAEGRAQAARLSLARPGEPPIELADLALDFGLGYDLGLGSLHVRALELRTRAARLALAGTLNELTQPARARGAMRLELAGELDALARELGLAAPAGGRELTGTWSGTFTLEGDQGSFRVGGETSVVDLRLAVPPEEEGGATLVIEEPKVALSLAARVALERLDVDLEKLTLDSGLARGGAQGRIENLRALAAEGAQLRGLSGSLAYVPDRLGLVLAPWLPGKLSGSEEKRVTFTLDGPLHELDALALLAGTQGRVELALGRFERPEVVLGGDLLLESRDRLLTLRGDLGANEGTLHLDGSLALPGARPTARSRLVLAGKAVHANSGLAPLLALVHPAFAGASLARGSLEGLIDFALDVRYDAPLALETLAGGWQALPKTPIEGTGRLSLSAASLRGSPLLGLLEGFGVDVARTLDVRPIEFTIQKGRVTYAKPWTWTFAGTETTFTGSLGLDETLDLAWNVPITIALVERWPFLASLQGETLALPLRGTVRAPRLESEALLKDLAAKAAERELAGRLGLGGSGGEEPAAILARADELWSKGEKAAAAKLYARLREDYKLSLTYALNKDRIKDRSRYQEPK